MFYFCATLLHQQISPAIPEEQPIFVSEGSRTRSAPLDIFASLMAAQKPPSGPKGGVGSNDQKGQSPFQPDDVLAGAE